MPDTKMGERVRERRLALKMTLAALARASGLSTGFISDLEQGRSKKTTSVYELARALGVTVPWLLDGKDAKGVREPPPAYSPGEKLLVHGYQLSEEACEFAQEFDKLDDAMREVVLVFVETLVARGKRSERARAAKKGSKPGRDQPDART